MTPAHHYCSEFLWTWATLNPPSLSPAYHKSHCKFLQGRKNRSECNPSVFPVQEASLNNAVSLPAFTWQKSTKNLTNFHGNKHHFSTQCSNYISNPEIKQYIIIIILNQYMMQQQWTHIQLTWFYQRWSYQNYAGKVLLIPKPKSIIILWKHCSGPTMITKKMFIVKYFRTQRKIHI